MDRWNDVRGEWPEGLVPVADKLVNPSVTAGTRAFLTTVGLPTSCALDTLSFYHDERLLRPVVRGEHTYVAFGDDSEIVPFVLAPESDEVYDLLPPAKTPSRFVNSTLPDFIYSLGFFCGRIAHLRGDSVARMRAAVRQVRTALTERDPRAMSEPSHWWPRLLHQVEEGRL